MAKRRKYVPLEEFDEKTSLGLFSKGLPHDDKGVADRELHTDLVNSLRCREPEVLEDVVDRVTDLNPEGRRLVTPSSYFQNDLNKDRDYQKRIPIAADTYSQDVADSYKEVAFWAVNRDKTFEEIEAENPIERTRAVDIDGVRTGPFVSQFLLQPYDYGQAHIDQRIHKFQKIDFGTNEKDFVSIQNGDRHAPPAYAGRGFIQTPRDLASYVSTDKDLQYLGALHYLVQNKYACDEGWPLGHLDEGEAGFVDYGAPNICRGVNAALYYGLKEAWRSKWNARNFKCRPEAYAGILQFQPEHLGDLADELKEDENIKALFDQHGTHLYPMAFVTGSPLHPTFLAGHGVTAYAGTAFLRMIIDEDEPMRKVVRVNSQGKLEEFENDGSITVGGELNKLAWNIAEARSMAGVHFPPTAGYKGDNFAPEFSENVAEYAFAKLTTSFPRRVYVDYTQFDGKRVQISA